MRTPPATLVAWLGCVARAQPRQPALVQDGSLCTYDELWARSRRIARGLLAQPRFAPGARVGLLGANEPAYLLAYLGILRAGGVAVPLNAMLTDDELAEQMAFVDACGVIAGDSDPDTRALLATRLAVWSPAELEEAHTEGRLPGVTPSSVACILLTSGTTGRPKGVVHTQGTMLHAGLQLVAAFPFGPEDRSVAFLPFFASIPEQVIPTLLAGGTLDIVPRFDPERISRACRDSTSFDAVPTLMARLLEHGRVDDLRRLRWVMFASEPMPVALLERWWEATPAVATHTLYGMTEMLTITRATDPLLRAAPDVVGTPFPTSDVAVVDRDGRPLPPGEAGEVVCASPARTQGYLDDAGATAAVLLPSGAIRTGDLGTLDEHGRLRLTGRLKDTIITGGLNVAPAEIEAVACRHPRVASAVVVGIPDARWGETPVVVAVPQSGDGLAPHELLSFCRGELPGFKRPSGAAVVESLPLTGIGKSAKAVVRQRVMQGEIELVRAG